MDLQLLGARDGKRKPEAEDGRILNRVYENKYFVFSIQLPGVWASRTEQVSSRFNSERGQASTLILERRGTELKYLIEDAK